jgi:D-glycero-alpha-D-manno-heptose-7-phosphate kinase
MLIESRAPVRVDFAGAWTDVKFFYEPFGGATLNAAINRYVTGRLAAGEGESREGLGVSYETEIPAGSGLGTSATLNVVWLSLAKGKPIQTQAEKEEIAARAYDIEKVLGIIGGKQDQYASAVGGINLFEFTEEGVTTHPVNVSAENVKTLESLLVLCYTGQARLSSNIHQNVWGNFRRGRRETVDALFTLRNSAFDGKEILEKGRFDQFGALLTLQFDCMKHLDSSTTNETVDSLFKLVADETAGGKPCGAGGGGCLMFCCKDPSLKPKVQEKISSAGFRVIDFAFEFEGLTVTFKD